MENSLYFKANWNDLPIELKTMIIHLLDRDSRQALQLCSRSDQQLVNSVPFCTIYKLALRNLKEIKSISICKTSYGSPQNFEFDLFDDFQKKLTEILEGTDHIVLMRILQTNMHPSQLMKLSTRGKLLKVEKLYFLGGCFKNSALVQEFDPFVLKQLTVSWGNLTEHLFDLPQVKKSSLIFYGQSAIRDEQLLKLEGWEIKLEICKNLTLTGINHFIQKCVFELNERHVCFKLRYQKENIDEIFEGLDIAKSTVCGKVKTVLVNSPSTNLQLKIEYQHDNGSIEGRTVQHFRNKMELSQVSNDTQTFNKFINGISIFKGLHDIKCFMNIRKNQNNGVIHHEFDTCDELQKQLTEELCGVFYIKKLTILDTSFNWILTDSRRPKISVGALVVRNYGVDVMECLKQIEPRYLKTITFDGKPLSEGVFDMPQVIFAETLQVRNNCGIRDDQLLELKAMNIVIHSDNDFQLTAQGINTFLKKRIINSSDLRRFTFSISNWKNLDSPQLVDGFETFTDNVERGCFCSTFSGQSRLYRYGNRIIIVVFHENHQLHITIFPISSI